MAHDPRWQLPKGKTPDLLYDWAFSLVRELRKGDYLPTPVSDADGISYDNTTSGLSADNVQDAIDENDSRLDALEAVLAGMVLLDSGTISDDAALDIALTSFTAFRGFRVVLYGIVPASGSDVQFWMRTSSDGGSSFDSGVSDYGWGATYFIANNSSSGTSGSESDNADSEILLDGAINSGSSCDLIIDAFGLSQTARAKFLISTLKDNAGTAIFSKRIGMRLAITDVDALRFLMSSGNIASGAWALYGYN